MTISITDCLSERYYSSDGLMDVQAQPYGYYKYKTITNKNLWGEAVKRSCKACTVCSYRIDKKVEGFILFQCVGTLVTAM